MTAAASIPARIFSCGSLRPPSPIEYTSAGMTPAEPPVGAVTTRWPRAFSSEPASA